MLDKKSEGPPVVRIGTRSSQLALYQTNLIKKALASQNPNTLFEVIPMETIGDKVLHIALSKIGDKSLFTKELEVALIANEVDIVIHSLKDVPCLLPEGLVIGCIAFRESPRDVVLMSPRYRGYKLADLPPQSVIGTSSVRRVAQLQRNHPHLKVISVRGTLNSRMKKLDDPESAASEMNADGTIYDALILAQAGIERLGWNDRIDEALTNENSLYAVGQGALAIECRSADKHILQLLSRIHDESAVLTCLAERSLLHRLGGGYSSPVSVNCDLRDNTTLELTASVLSLDGSECVKDKVIVQLPLLLAATNHADDCATSCPSCCARKSTGTESSEECDTILQNLVLEESSPDEVFVGIKIESICRQCRLRMVYARKCGSELADKLLQSGAERILRENTASRSDRILLGLNTNN